MKRWLRRGSRVEADADAAAHEAKAVPPVAGEEDGGVDYVTDAPIAKSADDRFGRGPWARRVAETIAAQRDAASLVVGVYGPWGDGKTSVLNLVEAGLADAPGVVPVRFNPWRLGDEAEMFRGFFETLAEALDERLATTRERIGGFLRTYGALLKPVPLAGDAIEGVAGAVGGALSETSLARQRQRIEELLAANAKRVVILIDDVDRLDKTEIQAMFRLVKVAADFKHTAYVLAFDHHVVADALAERFAAEPEHGARFMDKIIQLPLHLPPVAPEQLRTLALEAVDGALAQAGIELSESDAGSFVSAFDRAVAPRLTTPRTAKRYGNALLFALPMVGGEVHPVDLMLVEAMRVCYPRLYEWVRSHEREVLGPHPSAGGRDQPALAVVRAAVEAATAGLGAEDAARARILLTTLLPRTESAWENKSWGGDWDKQWAAQKRIASSLYFRRYLTYTVPPGDVRDADVDALLAAVDAPAPEPGQLASLADAVFDAAGAETVLPKIAARVPALGPDAAAHLAQVVTAMSARFPDASGFLGLSALERAALLVKDLVGRVRTGDRGELAVSLMRECEHLPFAVEVIRWLRPQDDEGDRAVITMAECDAAGRVLADRLLNAWCSSDPFAALGNKAAASLHVCAIYGDAVALRDCLRRQIDEDQSFAFALMRTFLGRAWSMETGVPLLPDLRREGYDALSEYVDPASLFPRLQERFGDSVGTGDEYAFSGLSPDERLAQQYARIHRAVAGGAAAD